jgi:hypothetical protein
VETTPAALPDPFDHDLSPWLLRRLDLAAVIATKLRTDADQVQQLLELEMALKMESTTSKTDKSDKTNKSDS